MKKTILSVSAIVVIAGAVIATNYQTSEKNNSCCSAQSACCYEVSSCCMK